MLGEEEERWGSFPSNTTGFPPQRGRAHQHAARQPQVLPPPGPQEGQALAPSSSHSGCCGHSRSDPWRRGSGSASDGYVTNSSVFAVCLLVASIGWELVTTTNRSDSSLGKTERKTQEKTKQTKKSESIIWIIFVTHTLLKLVMSKVIGIDLHNGVLWACNGVM